MYNDVHMLHELLQQQIDEHLKGVDASALDAFIRAVNNSYNRLERQSFERSTPFEGLDRHFRHTQEIAKVGSYEFAVPDGDLSEMYPVYWSDELCEILGYSDDVRLSRDAFLGRVHPDDMLWMRGVFYKAMQGDGVVKMEHRMVMPDGSEKYVLQHCEIIFEEHTGIPSMLIGTVQDITERWTAEEQLRQAHMELRTLFDNMEEVFFTIDVASFEILQISGACERVLGYAQHELEADPELGMSLILDEDRDRVLRTFLGALTRKSVVYEYRIRHKSGSVRYVESKLAPVINAEGISTKLYGITSDITSRKEAEQNLQEREHKFRTLIKNSSDVIMVMDLESKVTFASDSLFKVTGYTPEEVLGTSSIDTVHPNDQPSINRKFEEVLAGKSVINFAYRRKKKDGSYMWCEGTGTNLMDDPTVRGIVINFRDISERKEHERILKENEHRFRALIHNTFDAITVLNENLELVFASESIYKVTGFVPNEVLGMKGFCFTHPDDQELMDAVLNDVLKEPGRSRTVTYRRQKKDGRYIWCERVVTNLLHDPAIKGLVSNLRDVNEKKEYEQALQASNEELKKSNMELDRFVYSVSHDLRAPLLSILGIVDLIRLETSPNLVTEYLDMVTGSIHKLDGFIKDILDYSRNARLQPKKEVMDFGALLREIANHLKYMNGDSRVEIRTHVDDHMSFYSDPSRVSIVLSNLISNAIRYSNLNEVKPYVEVSVVLTERDAIIKVADNGIGIPAEHHKQIFDMFYRVSANSVGSGLGLYIVKETVNKLGGTIQLSSQPGEGTTFTITLPNLYEM
ncbi:MAG: PAS domain-containing sensor histidine kinase [Sphingobacteriales bacterium]|nr:MAG: PAS domain-containing sensor histidine kinase [Sphingobacteriales bacterium]